MKDRGIDIMYGRWLIEGAPRVLLIDTHCGYQYLDKWKGDLWDIAGIPTPDSDGETNEAIVFGYLVAWFLGEVRYPTGTAVCFYIVFADFSWTYPRIRSIPINKQNELLLCIFMNG